MAIGRNILGALGGLFNRRPDEEDPLAGLSPEALAGYYAAQAQNQERNTVTPLSPAPLAGGGQMSAEGGIDAALRSAERARGLQQDANFDAMNRRTEDRNRVEDARRVREAREDAERRNAKRRFDNERRDMASDKSRQEQEARMARQNLRDAEGGARSDFQDRESQDRILEGILKGRAEDQAQEQADQDLIDANRQASEQRRAEGQFGKDVSRHFGTMNRMAGDRASGRIGEQIGQGMDRSVDRMRDMADQARMKRLEGIVEERSADALSNMSPMVGQGTPSLVTDPVLRQRLSRKPQIGSFDLDINRQLNQQFPPTPEEAVEEELKKTSPTASVEPTVEPAVEPDFNEDAVMTVDSGRRGMPGSLSAESIADVPGASDLEMNRAVGKKMLPSEPNTGMRDFEREGERATESAILRGDKDALARKIIEDSQPGGSAAVYSDAANEAILSGRVSPQAVNEENLRKRAEAILSQEIENETKGMSGSERNTYLRSTGLDNVGPYEARLKKITNNLRSPSYGTGARLKVEPGASGVLKAPGFTSIEDASLNARRGLGVDAPQNQIVGESQNYTTEQLREMAAKDKAIMEETLDQEVVPISQSEELGDSFDETETTGTASFKGNRNVPFGDISGRNDPSVLSAETYYDSLGPSNDPGELGSYRTLGDDPRTVTDVTTPDMETPVAEEEKEQSFFGKIGQLIKNNPEVAAQIAQLGGGLISSAAQGKAQRKADAETQRRLARANLTGAFTGRTPAVQAATADTGGLFSLDTLGRAIGGGGKIAQDELTRLEEERQQKVTEDLARLKDAREQEQLELDREISRGDLANKQRQTEINNLSVTNQKAYNDSLIGVKHRDVDARYDANTKNFIIDYLKEENADKPGALPAKQIGEFASSIGTLRQLDTLEDFLTSSKMSFLEQGPLSLDEPMQYIFGPNAKIAEGQIQALLRGVAQTVPGVLTELDQKRLEKQMISLNDTPMTASMVANVFREELVASLQDKIDMFGSEYRVGMIEKRLEEYKKSRGMDMTDQERKDQSVAQLGKV
tara:strand:- start:186 stop:3293 length:3108 start_codon:yes stop_codon:yes gene_type:complete